MSDLHGDASYAFVGHPTHSSSLMVVCLTRFNDFGVSPSVITATLLECGYSVLVLKDRSKFRFLRGVPGLGADLGEVAQAVTRLCREQSVQDVYCTGFSSSGYASLYLAILLGCRGYIGFAVELDYSSESPAWNRRRAVRELDTVVKPSDLCNLKDKLIDLPSTTKTIFYAGDQDRYDVAALEGVAAVRGCQVEIVAGCDHNVPVYLIEHGELKSVFENLLFNSRRAQSYQ